MTVLRVVGDNPVGWFYSNSEEEREVVSSLAFLKVERSRLSMHRTSEDIQEP